MADTRPGWEVYFLGIAEAVSLRADCRRRAVGAVLVDRQRVIIATGYNGVRPGAPGCLAGACPRGLLDYNQVTEFADYSDPASPGYCTSTHAEMNAMHYAGRSARGAMMFITCAPCPACLKSLTNAGLLSVTYPDPDRPSQAVTKYLGG